MKKMKIPELDRRYAQQSTGLMTQLAVQLSNVKDIPKVINNFKKMFMGLRLSTDGEYLYKKKYDNNLHRLPFHLSNCREALDYAYESLMPDWKDSMAYIAVGENNLVTITSNHLLADGTFMINALKHCLDDKISQVPEFPKPVFEAYQKTIEDIQKKDIKVPDKIDVTKFYYDLRNKPSKSQKPTNDITLEFPAESLQCFDKAKNRCQDLTYYLSSASAVSTMALTRLQTKFGLRNMIDLREFMSPDKFDLAYCNHNASIALDAPNIRLSNSISDLHQAFKQLMEYNLKKGAVFASLKNNQSQSAKKDNITTTCLSNLGDIECQSPIKDFWIQTKMSSAYMSDSIQLLTYSKIQGKNNHLVLRLSHDKSLIPPKDGERFAKSIVYALQNLPPTTELADAVNKVRKFNNFI